MKIQLDTNAFLPERAHEEDAGLDLRSVSDGIVKAHSGAVFDTGVHIQLPYGTAGLLVSKSGLNTNHDITSTGLIDEGYTGSIRIKLYNHGDTDYVVHRGDKISQMVILSVQKPQIESVDKINGASRGDNGFGSTGK